MQRHRYTQNRLYLFNLVHRDFVEGKLDVFPTAVTRKFAVRQFVYLFLLIALPMVLFITVMIAWAGYHIEFLLIVELVTALLSCAYFVLRGYLKDRGLRYKGNIIYGEVIRQDEIPGYANIGTSTITRIFYRFINSQEKPVIACIDLNNVMHRLPDGRKYPAPGTPVAILYANDKNHKLL